jgi:predicted MFS family arabinose efflux permease
VTARSIARDSSHVASRARERRVGRAVWFWATGGILFLLVAASAAPAPLYRVYQKQWGFSASTLTAVFAVYVLALLVTLLIGGSLSDHVARRPIIAAGLALEIAACLLFVSAGGIGSLLAARGVQGIAVGLMTGALSAALLDMRPTGELAPLLSSTCATAGLAFGALTTSVLVQYGPAPTQLPWWLLLAGFGAGTGVVAAMPEPGDVRPGALASLRPHVGVPKPARAAFAVAVPCIVGSWALGGFYLSLGPSLVLQQLDSTNVVWGGLSIALLCGVGSAASVARRNQEPRRMMLEGCCALVAGGAVGVAAIALRLPAALFVSAAVAGLGFGPVFVGAFRTVVAIAPADDRAGLVAAIFTVAYVSFGAPALGAGFATTRFGLRSTGLVYSAAVVALAGMAAVSLLVGRRPAYETLPEGGDLACPPAAPCTRAYCSRRPEADTA